MVTRVPVAPAVISWAREACGLTLEGAAQKLDMRPDQLEKLENGEVLPSATVFRKMSATYLLPEATLLAARPPAVPTIPTDHRTFDGLRATISYATFKAIRRVQDRQRNLVELAEDDESLTPPTLPVYTLGEDPQKAGEAERARIGFAISTQLELSAEKAFMNWRLMLEDAGISVYTEDFPTTDARGVSLIEGGFPAIILSRNEKLPGARLFTLFHEYAHILTRSAGISDFNPKSAIETYCNKFAAAFLMPESALVTMFGPASAREAEPSLSRLTSVANALSVTISALALRLEETGRVTAGFYGRLKSLLAASTPPNAPGAVPQKYLIIGRIGHRYTDAVLTSMSNGYISPLEASRMLNAKPTYFSELRQVIDNRRADLLDA
jgi:Zn-dependent peptidase ImmA (M78 family)/transcriptional regulator with XRE-family HTH domain